MNIEKFLEINKDNCIVLLKTSRVGEEVDNGMGVEFDLKLYALICKDEEALIFSEEDKEDDYRLFQKFEVDRIKSLEEMIKELKDQDDYDVIWKNNEYKKPDSIKTNLIKCGYSIDMKIKTSYKILVSYEEISKYYKSRTKPSSYEHDFFIELVRNQSELEKIAGKYFISDRVKLKNTFYSEKGIEFLFDAENNKGDLDIHSDFYFNSKETKDLKGQEQVENINIYEIQKALLELLKLDKKND